VLFPHTVYVYPSTARTDGDGNTVRWADLDREPVPVPAFVQPRASTETDAGPGQRAAVEQTAYLSRFAPPLDPWCAIEYDGVVYEIDGWPSEHKALTGELRYSKVVMRASDRG